MPSTPSPGLRERLFQTAVERIREDGYDGITVSHITKEVGVAKGTFFNYFATKDHVLAEALRRMVDRAFQAAAGLSGTDAIFGLLGPLARELASDRMLTEAIVVRLPILPAPTIMPGPGSVRDEERLQSWLEDRLSEVLPRSIPLAELDRPYLASLLTWAIRGSLEEWVRGRTEDASLEAAFDERVRALLDAQGLPVDSE